MVNYVDMLKDIGIDIIPIVNTSNEIIQAYEDNCGTRLDYEYWTKEDINKFAEKVYNSFIRSNRGRENN